MKNGSVGIVFAVALIGVAAMASAGSRAGGNCAVNDTTDGGGLRTASTNYAMDGSIGGIGGISSNAVPRETVKQGYIGQLAEVASLTVTASPSVTNEDATSQLGGLAGLDDATLLVLDGSNIIWSLSGFPIGSINPAGIATSLCVYSNTPGTVTGSYLGVTGSCVLLVLDSNPDNYGIYAGDGIPDWWQVRYFGTNNPQGLACATNCTGQNNLYTYTADLDPTNPASTFAIVAISNQPPDRLVCFGTTSTGRVYRLLCATNIVSGVWTNVPGANWTSGLAGQMSLCDTNTTAVQFYRVNVQAP